MSEHVHEWYPYPLWVRMGPGPQPVQRDFKCEGCQQQVHLLEDDARDPEWWKHQVTA